jgi:hypothetical protein
MIFGTHDEVFRLPSTSFEYNVSHTMDSLRLSFASNPTGGPARWTRETGYSAWLEYADNTTLMVLFASSTTVQQLVTGARIDQNCTGL